MSISNANLQKYLFNRKWSVTIGQPTNASNSSVNSATAFQYTSEAIANANNGLVPQGGLRTTFDIDKNSLGTASKSKIEIYNLSTESRQRIKKGNIVQVAAGYQNIIDTIFTGNIVTTISKRVGAAGDIVTSMECEDSGQNIAITYFDQTYPGGTQMYKMLEDLASAMGVNFGISVGIPNVSYNFAVTLNGSIAKSLDMLLKPSGMEWNIQNGNLNILPLKNVTNSTAILISATTGMIGVPSDNGQFVQFTSLLNPKIIPSSYVQIVSENKDLNGFYKVLRSKIEGDSHGSKWQVSCECIPQDNVLGSLPTTGGSNLEQAVNVA